MCSSPENSYTAHVAQGLGRREHSAKDYHYRHKPQGLTCYATDLSLQGSRDLRAFPFLSSLNCHDGPWEGGSGGLLAHLTDECTETYLCQQRQTSFDSGLPDCGAPAPSVRWAPLPSPTALVLSFPQTEVSILPPCPGPGPVQRFQKDQCRG